jgi:hypothetical protein
MQNGLPATGLVKLTRNRKPKHQNEEDEGRPDDQPHQISSSFVNSETLGDTSNPVSARDGQPVGKSTAHLKSVRKRRPYEWEQLQGLGITAVALQTDGMNIFHLEKVAKLARHVLPHILYDDY